MEKYLDHYRLNGFLGEDDLGLWFEEKNIWNLYSILFRHFIQNKWGHTILPILEKEFKTGKIPVEIYAVMVDLDDNMNGRFCSIQHQYITTIGVRDHHTPIKVDKESMDKLNENRMHIGLDSFHVALRYAKMDRFCQKGFGKEYNFLQYSIIDNLPVSLFNSEKSKQYIKNLVILPNEIKSTCLCDLFY